MKRRDPVQTMRSSSTVSFSCSFFFMLLVVLFVPGKPNETSVRPRKCDTESGPRGLTCPLEGMKSYRSRLGPVNSFIKESVERLDIVQFTLAQSHFGMTFSPSFSFILHHPYFLLEYKYRAFNLLRASSSALFFFLSFFFFKSRSKSLMRCKNSAG